MEKRRRHHVEGHHSAAAEWQRCLGLLAAVHEHEVVVEGALERATALRALLARVGRLDGPLAVHAQKPRLALDPAPHFLTVNGVAETVENSKASHVARLDDDAIAPARLDAHGFAVAQRLVHVDPVVVRVDTGVHAHEVGH